MIMIMTIIMTMIISNGNRTEWSPTRSVIIQVINKIGRPCSRSPICLITSMITDRNGRHEVLLPIVPSAVTMYRPETQTNKLKLILANSSLLSDFCHLNVMFVCLLLLRWEKWQNSDKNSKLVTVTSSARYAINHNFNKICDTYKALFFKIKTQESPWSFFLASGEKSY